MARKVLLSANEAVAHAAYRAGCAVATAYPGTPSTEIMETVAKFKDDIVGEWAVNEKVAVEVAIGASLAGTRALTAMKHVGLNVAMDPIMTFTYIGAIGGLVVVVADDPGMHSSQNEQDSRALAKFARVALFEPADSQEAYDMTVAAFELSEQFEVPVFVRLTTRTSHASTLVDLGEGFAYGNVTPKPYVKNIQRNLAVPAFARLMRLKAEKRTAALCAFAAKSSFNCIDAGDRRLGIVTSGIAYQYVKEVFPEFSVLKLGLTNPLPLDLVRQFADGVERLVVVEELDPVMEEQIRAAGIVVTDTTTALRMMELNPLRLSALRHELLGDIVQPEVQAAPAGLPTRPPVLCAGCSHRSVFYTLAKLKTTVTGDIGCYTLGAFAPLNAMDTAVCMGASIGTAFGMQKAGHPGRIAAVIGDSTFFHSGMTGLLDVVYNRGTITVIVLDNRITAMTGHQHNPGSGKTLAGEDTVVADIATICRALGVKRVCEVDAYNLAELERVLKEELDTPEVSVVVVKGPCVLAAKKNIGATPYEVDDTKCVACGACFKLGCPAIVRGEAADAAGKRFKSVIEPSMCIGCDQCRQVCKFGAIHKRG